MLSHSILSVGIVVSFSLFHLKTPAPGRFPSFSQAVPRPPALVKDSEIRKTISEQFTTRELWLQQVKM